MAPLNYKSSLGRYRRFLQTVQNRPLLGASLFLVMSLVLVIVLLVAALRPTLITIAGLTGEINQQKDIAEKLNQKITAISAAQQLLARNSEKLLLLDQALPLQAQTGPWTAALARVASESGIQVENLAITDVSIKQASPEAEMKFSITAAGPYIGLKQFLQILESLRRLITIESVSFSQPTTPGDPLRLNIIGILRRSL